MDWGTIGTVIGSACGVVFAIYSFMRNFKEDINKHIDRLEKEWKEESAKTETRYFEMNNRYFETNKRMDSVYRILMKKFDLKTDP